MNSAIHQTYLADKFHSSEPVNQENYGVSMRNIEAANNVRLWHNTSITRIIGTCSEPFADRHLPSDFGIEVLGKEIK